MFLFPDVRGIHTALKDNLSRMHPLISTGVLPPALKPKLFQPLTDSQKLVSSDADHKTSTFTT